MVPFLIAFFKYIYKNSNCKLQSKPLKRTLRWAIESVCIKRIEFIEKWEGSLFPRARKTVRNNEVSVITGIRKAGFDCTLLTHYPQSTNYSLAGLEEATRSSGGHVMF